MNRTCFVDETVVNKNEVTYIALVAKKSENFSTFDNFDKLVKNNLHKIKNFGIRNKAREYWKSQHILMIEKDIRVLKGLVVSSEFHEKKKFKSARSEVELVNRLIGLKRLIKNIDANTFHVDNYSNKSFKKEIIDYGSSLSKKVIFVDATSSKGVRLADLFLKLY